MASRPAGLQQPRKSTSKYANSPSSSTTSSSKQFPEASVDNLSSPASSARSKPQYFYSESLPLDCERSKENVTVTVRFRPLSPREIRRGEEIAWYADGETILRNEQTPSIAYAYDRVFGPTTTTRHVYDIAAQHVVSGAMEGVNGTIFAYGVTSSGKTHTMHGDQRSPGIIPLAVKDAFSIIQETPNHEFLLRVSYLEIYNEVVNDLLNPAGQDLRIREDGQGTFVEGIKEEVVLSPAHALSLIAAGEEHRHVGSTNFNLLSSRSHTIFTLTIESSPCENSESEAVNFSQLNLIDLAGSESSKAETTGVRQKEGSYINKSLLTLGTVISKLTDGRNSHIPYRESKLTRLLQSSLSGHGRVSLICTVTPSSSNSEETHNTLKFAHRAKHIEVQAAQNKIVDEKSLIKKYQSEIRSLKEELEQLKRGVVTVPQLKHTGSDDFVILKQKLEDGRVKLQSRLEEEEAKAALLSRIQRLTKLILVSTKSSHSSGFSGHPGLRRGHSFGEEELAYLPHRRRDLSLDDENIELYVSLDGSVETNNDVLKEEKKIKKPGLLNWLKLRKRDGALTASDKSSGAKSISPLSTPSAGHNHPIESVHSHFFPTECTSAESLSVAKQDRQIDDDACSQQETPMAEKTRLNDEIKLKNEQISFLESQIADSVASSHHTRDEAEQSRSVSELEAQLNEKSFELEVKTADNRIIQEQLNKKINECEGLQETIASLKQLLSDTHDSRNVSLVKMEDTKEDLLRQAQAFEIEELKQKVVELTESKQQLENRNKKLAEESSYAKGLASAAAVELKALSEEVAKLMNHNERLTAELAAPKNSSAQRKTTGPTKNGRRDTRPKEQSPTQMELKRELALSREREMSYETLISEKDRRESELRRRVEESKEREAYLENELANMWVMVAKLKRTQGAETEASESSKESQRIDGWEIWDGIGETKEFV
ncbi:kinesin-like protein KIN-7K, chloroplastic [Cynara cardunculus var. scolymus]|uniref:kinesin-like protein KIN-7K, chloroplastic n=1 Tax=Cynara cardunculus var. scolymus TaxID=59895 RepID=UPI000D62A2BD|nr:kinesin-like protein KIN-7K, chloroplastic [Cynara cardunculus var. scolymus]